MQPKCCTEEIESKPLKDIIPVCGLRKLEKSFEDVPLLDEESNDYNIIINFEILKQFWCRFVIPCSEYLSKIMEIVYHVAWVMLMKSTLFVETAVIKNIHTSKQSQKE